MKKNTQWFSIIIAIGLVLFISLSSYVILDTIIPFSKNTKGIEQSTSAYYFAWGAVEQALYFVSQRPKSNLTTESGSTLSSTSTGMSFQTFSSGVLIPSFGKGNSEYNRDYNQISLSEPIQMEVGDNVISNWNTVIFDFKIPAFTWGTLTLVWGASTPIINWTLVGENESLVADGTFVNATQITQSSSTWKAFWQSGRKLDGSTQLFQSFYSAHCGTWKSCILKMSVVNSLALATGQKIPYIEYKINFNGVSVPERYTRIEASGKSYGFKKTIEVQVPQQTINQAFDFTVFQ